MRTLATICLLLIGCTADSLAQGGYTPAPTERNIAVERLAAELDKALVRKDSVELKVLLHPKLSYGHSNGWIETQREVINDLYNGKLTYEAIEPLTNPVVTTVEGKAATVRTEVKVKVIIDSKPMELKLRVWQAWVNSQNGWKLISRQSVRID